MFSVVKLLRSQAVVAAVLGNIAMAIILAAESQ